MNWKASAASHKCGLRLIGIYEGLLLKCLYRYMYVMYNVLDHAKLDMLNGVVLVLVANGLDLGWSVCRID